MGDIPNVTPPVTNEVPKTEATPPVAANAAPKPVENESRERTIPYPRFKEVVDKKNDLESRLKKLEEKAFKNETPDYIEAAVKKLVDEGMEADAAQKLVATQREIAAKEAESRVAEVREAATKKEVDEWLESFQKSHPDYAELEPEMTKAFMALSPTVQDLVSADPRGVQLLYDHVKVAKLEAELKAKYEQGIQDGYKNKQLKEGLSPAPAAGPKGLPSLKDIEKMPMSEYVKIREEVLKNRHSLT